MICKMLLASLQERFSKSRFTFFFFKREVIFCDCYMAPQLELSSRGGNRVPGWAIGLFNHSPSRGSQQSQRGLYPSWFQAGYKAVIVRIATSLMTIPKCSFDFTCLQHNQWIKLTSYKGTMVDWETENANHFRKKNSCSHKQRNKKCTSKWRLHFLPLND